MRLHARSPSLPRRRPLAPALLLLVNSLGCGACHQLTSTSVGTIGKDGGTLHSDDCGFTLVIPPGALPQDVPFVLQTVSSPDLPAIPGRVRVSKVCEVQPVIPLGKPAKLTLSFDPAQLPKRVAVQDVDARVAPSNKKEVRLQDLSVDAAKSQVSATTTATGSFFATSPQGPQVAEIDLTPSGSVALNPGATQQFSAVVKDDTGEPDPTPPTWSVDVARVASVDANGLLTAKAPGHTTLTAAVGAITATADVYVISAQPSPASFAWENPRPQGNAIRGLSFAEGLLVTAGDNGTVMLQQPDGGFARVTSGRAVQLAGAAVGGGRAGAAGTLDLVQQSVELIAGVLLPLEPGGAAQQVDSASLSPRAVFGDDAGVIAVGAGNDAYLLRNGDPTDAGWVALETPVSEALIAVDADPSGGRRVLGARGQLYRQADQDWFPISDQPLDTLLTLGVNLGHDAYAVDGANGLRHFVEGAGWQPDQTPAGVTLDHVSLLGRLDGALALAGADSQLRPHLWLRDGSSWVDQPGLDVRDELYAAAALPGQAGWVGGSNGALYRVADGGVLPVRTGPIDDVSAIAVGPDGSAYAVTSSGCGDAFCISLAAHLLVRAADGTWSALADFSASAPLRAVAVRSAGDVFIAGDNGLAWHYDGAHVTALQTPGADDVHALRVCGSDVWMAGDRGLIARFDGAQTFASVSNLGANLWSLSCPSAPDIWAAGDYALYHFDGTSWTYVDPGDVNQQAWRAVSASAEEVWVAGESGYLLHGDRVSSKFEAVQQPAGLRLHGGYGLWQSGPGDLYLVGSQQRPRQAVLLRYDGAQWYPLDPGTDHELFGIDGSSPGDFFIAGRGGAILHAAQP